MLTPPMVRIIETYSCGSVATVNDDGTPAVSPKATFVVAAPDCIAFGNIRSPGTAANLTARPAVEVVFTDILTRRAVRVRGTGDIVAKDSDDGRALMPVFETRWGPYIESMEAFVRIRITAAEMVLSPAYDRGETPDTLREANLAVLNAL